MSVGTEEQAASAASGRSMEGVNASRRVLDGHPLFISNGGLAPLWGRGGARGLGGERRQEVLS